MVYFQDQSYEHMQGDKLIQWTANPIYKEILDPITSCLKKKDPNNRSTINQSMS